jgi:hypothetical protein
MGRLMQKVSDTAVMMWVSPILPGKLEAWRRLYQELAGTRRRQYLASRRRLGIVREQVWLVRTAQTDMAVVLVDGSSPDRMLSRFIDSEQPFDHWFKRQIRQLHGVDLTSSSAGLFKQVIFDGSQTYSNLAKEEELE